MDPRLAVTPPLVTVRLVPADLDLIEAELRDPAELAALIGVALPGDWPPEHHGPQHLAFTAARLREGPEQRGWWTHWFVARAGEEETLAGIGGYKGPPRDGAVEIGYSVVPSLRRRGIATAAVSALIDAVRDRDDIERVVADTLPELTPSIGVLQQLGFRPAPSPEPGVLRFELPLR